MAIISKNEAPFNAASQKILNNWFAYKYAEGLFCMFENETITYGTKCREQIAVRFKEDINQFVFVAPADCNLDNLVKFFSLIEKRLNLKNLEDKLVITTPRFTHINGIVFCSNIPAFWRSSELRRSVFTLFFRAGAIFYKGGDDI